MKFLKNLAHEAKPTREKFRGQGGAKMGVFTLTWHGRLIVGVPFAHPPPDDMSAHESLSKIWPHVPHGRS